MITCLFLPHTTHASQSGLEGKTAWNSCPVYWSLSFFAIANSVKRDERTTTKGNESEQLSVLKKLVFSFVQRFFALFTPLDSSCLVFLFKLFVRSFSVSAKFNFCMCITSSTVNGLIIARRKKYVKKRQLKPKERERKERVTTAKMKQLPSTGNVRQKHFILCFFFSFPSPSLLLFLLLLLLR